MAEGCFTLLSSDIDLSAWPIKCTKMDHFQYIYSKRQVNTKSEACYYKVRNIGHTRQNTHIRPDYSKALAHGNAFLYTLRRVQTLIALFSSIRLNDTI